MSRTSEAELAREFKRGFASTFGLDLVTKVLGVVTLVVLVRGLSVSSFAYITVFLTFAQFAGAAAGGGVRTRYLREEAERISRSPGSSVEASILDPLLKGTLLVVGVGICGAVIAWTTGFQASSGGARFMLLATAFAVAYSAIELAIAHFQARRRFSSAGALGVLRAAVLLAAAVGIALSSQSTVAISVWLIASISVVTVITVGPIVRRSLLAHARVRHLSWPNREEMWLSFYYVVAAGFAYVDVMVAAALLDESQVATLGAALRYLAIILAAIPALGAVLRVRTSQSDLVDSPSKQRAMVVRWFRRSTVPTALLVGGAILLAPIAIPVVDGGRYPDSIPVLQIFLVTAFSAYVLAPGPSMLMAQRQYVALAAIYGVGLTLNAVGDVAVAPVFGVVGIAVVSSLIYVAMDVVTVVWSLRYVSRAHA